MTVFKTLHDTQTTRNLPPRTVEVLNTLASLVDERGEFVLTTAELATHCGVSRQTLTTHLDRLRAKGLLVDGTTTISADGTWRRIRRLTLDDDQKVFEAECVATCDPLTNPPYKPPSPLTNPPYNLQYILEGMEGNQGVDSKPFPRFARGGSSEEQKMITLDDVFTEIATRDFDRHDLPPYPSTERFRAVKVPPMPRLPDDDSAAAKMLVNAFKAVCTRYYKKRPRVDRATIFRMKHAVGALRSHKIVSPYAWASFRLAQWQLSEQRAHAPSIDYVFSRDVIAKNAGHFANKAESYEVRRRLLLAPSHVELLTLWDRCISAVSRKQTDERGVVTTRAIISMILPREKYDRLAAAIPAEREALEVDLLRRMVEGEWVW